jgi:hypothetical protein
MTPLPTTSSSSSTGIDIRDALAILSARKPHDHDHHDHHHHDHHPGIGHDDDLVPREELRGMGQVIDMNATTTTTRTGDDDGSGGGILDCEDEDGQPSSVEEEQRRRHRELDVARSRRTKEIRDEIHSMDTFGLIRTIFDAQQNRVMTYRTYDDGLSGMLNSGNVVSYPTLCASVTANFALLSDTINHARDALAGKDGGRGTQYDVHVRRLQEEECEKLRLTAAMHLERLRLHDIRGGGDRGGGSHDDECENDNGGNDDEDVTARLLRESVRRLKNDISECVCRINDILEEMRCIAADDA